MVPVGWILVGACWYIGLSTTDFVFWKIGIVFLGVMWYALRSQPRALLFIVVIGLSTFLSIEPKTSFLGIHGEWAWGFLSACFFLLLTEVRTSGNWLKWLGVGLSVHCLLQRYGIDPIVNLAILPGGYSTAYIGTHIDAGVLIAMSFPVLGRWLPLGLAGLWATHSRSGWMGALFALCPERLRVYLLPLFLVPFFLQAPKDIARVELWRIGITSWQENPILGSGPSTYQWGFERLKTDRLTRAVGHSYMQGHAHNDLVESLCTTGILGLLAYLWWVLPFLRNPSLLALFVALKFNPVGFETLAAGALIAGNMNRELLIRRRQNT